MSSIILLPQPPQDPISHPNNSPFRCIYRNPTGKQFNCSEIIIGKEKWDISVKLYEVSGMAEIQIKRSEELPDIFEDNFIVEVFVKIANPCGEDLVFEKAGPSRKKFSFRLTEETLRKVSASLQSFDFLAQINFRRERKDENYRCSTFQRMCSDLVLVLEGKKVFVDVEYLAKHSRYFAEITKILEILEKDKEIKLPLLSLPGVNYKNFLRLVEIASYPEEITVKSIASPSLHLAHFFKFEKVIATYENFLLRDEFDYFSLCYKLCFAQFYRLPKLEEVCLERITKIPLHKMMMDKFFGNLVPETKTKVLERLYEKTEQEINQIMLTVGMLNVNYYRFLVRVPTIA